MINVTSDKPWRDRRASVGEEHLVVADLDKRMQPFGLELLAWLRSRGHDPYLIWGRRSKERQKHFGDEGTSQRPDDSPHLYGLAMDVVDRKLWWGKGAKTEAERARVEALWAAIGTYCEQTGLGWGGKWKSLYDPAHVEWHEGAATMAERAEKDSSIDGGGELPETDEPTVEVPCPACGAPMVPHPDPEHRQHHFTLCTACSKVTGPADSPLWRAGRSTWGSGSPLPIKRVFYPPMPRKVTGQPPTPQQRVWRCAYALLAALWRLGTHAGQLLLGRGPYG